MDTPEIATQKLMRLNEQLRQESEIFDQRKSQGERWFNLRLRMGYMAVLILPLLMIISSYIIFYSEKFHLSVVITASTTLLVDVAGTIFSVWKLVLNPDSFSKVEPITNNFDRAAPNPEA